MNKDIQRVFLWVAVAAVGLGAFFAVGVGRVDWFLMGPFIAIFPFSFIPAFAAGSLAVRRRRNYFPWWIAGFVAGALAWLVVLIVPEGGGERWS